MSPRHDHTLQPSAGPYDHATGTLNFRDRESPFSCRMFDLPIFVAPLDCYYNYNKDSVTKK